MNNEKCDRLFENNFNEARIGESLWKNITNEFSINSNDYVMLVDTLEEEYRIKIIGWLSKFLTKNSIKKFVMLTCDEDFFAKIDSDIIVKKYLSTEQMLFLFGYFRLINPICHCMYVKFDEIYGTDYVIGHCGVTFDDYLNCLEEK